MPFTFKQVSPLEIIIKNDEELGIIEDDESQEIIEVPLRQVGDLTLVRGLRFKEDREEWYVLFQGEIDRKIIKVRVTYSLGMDGHQVEDVSVMVPDGLEVFSEPEFETRDC